MLYCRAFANIRSIFFLADSTVFSSPLLILRLISLREIGCAII